MGRFSQLRKKARSLGCSLKHAKGKIVITNATQGIRQEAVCVDAAEVLVRALPEELKEKRK